MIKVSSLRVVKPVMNCRHGYPDQVDQIYGPGRFRTDGPDNQRKARRLKQKRDQTTAQAQSNSTGSDLKINLNLVLTGLIEF